MATVYETSRWRDFRSRVLADDAECAFAHLAGHCRGALHVHHVEPLAEGGPEFPRNTDGTLVLCAAHHAWLHAWRRRGEPKWKRCPHHHRSLESRRQCEERLNRTAAA